MGKKKIKNCPRCGEYKGGDICPTCNLSRHDKTGTHEGRSAGQTEKYSDVMERTPQNGGKRR